MTEEDGEVKEVKICQLVLTFQKVDPSVRFKDTLPFGDNLVSILNLSTNQVL